MKLILGGEFSALREHEKRCRLAEVELLEQLEKVRESRKNIAEILKAAGEPIETPIEASARQAIVEEISKNGSLTSETLKMKVKETLKASGFKLSGSIWKSTTKELIQAQDGVVKLRAGDGKQAQRIELLASEKLKKRSLPGEEVKIEMVGDSMK